MGAALAVTAACLVAAALSGPGDAPSWLPLLLAPLGPLLPTPLRHWVGWRATIRGEVGAHCTAEDLQWFAEEAWERLTAVPVYDSDAPPDYASFFREHVAASIPLVIRRGAAHAGWDEDALPWTREWLEGTAGARTQVPLHINLDRCWSRIHGEGGRLVRPARMDVPLAAALRLIAGDSAAPPPPGPAAGGDALEDAEGCDGAAAEAVAALLRGESASYTPPPHGTVHTLEEVSLPGVLQRLLPHAPEPPWTAALLEPLFTNVWIGSANKTSVTHFDDYENVLVQAAGRKTVTLFDPLQLVFLYANEVPQTLLTVAAEQPAGPEWEEHRRRFLESDAAAAALEAAADAAAAAVVEEQEAAAEEMRESEWVREVRTSYPHRRDDEHGHGDGDEDEDEDERDREQDDEEEDDAVRQARREAKRKLTDDQLEQERERQEGEGDTPLTSEERALADWYEIPTGV